MKMYLSSIILISVQVSIKAQTVTKTFTQTSNSGGADITCIDDEDCHIICDGSLSCADSSILCPANAKCQVECNAYYSCSDISIKAEPSSALSLGCNFEYSCQSSSKWASTILCPLGGDCEIIANGNGALRYNLIEASYSKRLHITASAQFGGTLEADPQCPIYQPTECSAQCIIDVITEPVGSLSLPVALNCSIHAAKATDIQFRYEGDQYDKMLQDIILDIDEFGRTQCNLILDYDPNDFINTNALTCSGTAFTQQMEPITDIPECPPPTLNPTTPNPTTPNPTTSNPTTAVTKTERDGNPISLWQRILRFWTCLFRERNIC